MRRFILVGLLAAAACGKERGTDTRLEHPAAGASDSAIAQSKLPGSSGVRRAMEAADSAKARRAAEDSIP